VRYFEERFGEEWSVSPEHSLSLHSGNWSVPSQLLVRSPKARNKVTQFPYETSILDMRAAMPDEKAIVVKAGIRLFSLESALIACSANFFTQHSTDARAALSILPDASTLLALLLEGGHSTIAGRLAGAFRNIGRTRIADDIVSAMTSAGYSIRETDTFEDQPRLVLARRDISPYVNRIRLMWQTMREPVLEYFPIAPKTVLSSEEYLKQVEDAYVNDAYHSLSIEGYQVTPELIERVRKGSWNPDASSEDKEHRNALAARGYWQAFQAVEKSIEEILSGKNAGVIAEKDHGTWYRELFAPSVTAGVLRPADLAGYRTNRVYIRRSMHVPPSHEAVRDIMPSFFELLEEETEPAVRVVLGHFVFVYIHPFSDGNGRIGRFLMNAMLASGGYPWTIVPVEKRHDYMVALEQASVGQNIIPFAKFISGLLKQYCGQF
jgi:fido (protein-threonine AMPylation protein)